MTTVTPTVDEIRAGATVNGALSHEDAEIEELLTGNFKSHDTLVCTEPRTFGELRKLLDRKVDELPDSFLYECINRNELGSAELFCRAAKGDLVYDRSSESWFFWNNLHWQKERGGNVNGLAGDVLSGVYRKTAAQKYKELLDLQATIGDRKELTKEEEQKIDRLKEERSSAEKKAKDLYKLAYIRNVLVFAGASELLGVIGDEWDTKINLLGVNNAVIDLTTGKPVKPEPSQYIRTVAPVNYDPQAKCPLWDKTILEIFANDTEMVAYIQRFLGYAMSGTCQESDFPVWHGKDGRNGKELILGRVRATLGGKLTGAVEPELFLKSKNPKGKNEATPALMALQGRRIAWASETEEGRKIDNSAMKDLSGGHILTGRYNYGDQVEWKRTHTLILLTNSKPHVDNGGGAEWERIKLVSFTESFVTDPDKNNPHQHKKDAKRGDKIDASELPGVLNWLIAGGLEWRKNGLQTPSAVKMATAQYRTDEDTLGRFIDECCYISRDVKIKSSALYDEYKAWCSANEGGGRPMGSRTFGAKILERGYEYKRETDFRGFLGIGLSAKS